MTNTCCGGSERTSRRVKKSGCGCGSTSVAPGASRCCGAEDAPQEGALSSAVPALSARSCVRGPWVTGSVATPVGSVPQVSTRLSAQDIIGSWRCRWSIGRMDYKVDPGLYAVGTPDSASAVLVTANYKMTFDRLRAQLDGLNLWIVVLDTDGVNVWCAAGKGTFCAEEVVHRVAEVKLTSIVSHRNLILPQLGAVGVAAHTVRQQSGFRVLYGPVRAKDIRQYFTNNLRATEAMRTVEFPVGDRAVLTPMELVGTATPVLVTFGVFFVLNAVGIGHYGWTDLYGILCAVLIGAVITPILLPWIPGRAFSFKGGLLGLLWAIAFLVINGFPSTPAFGWLKAAAYFLLLPALSGFVAMNFTGSSTFTSLSGVDREMKTAIPVMLLCAVGAVILLFVSDLIRLFGGALI